MSLAGMEAVNCAALTNVVVRGLPFHQTLEALTNPVPLMVSVNAPPPAKAEFGLKFVIAGEGLLIVNVAAGDEPPPGAGLLTTTLTVPAVAMSVAGIEAVNCVALTNCVVRWLPFHQTVEAPMKPVPLTVSINAALPAKAELGLKLVMAGTGFGCWMVTVPCVNKVVSTLALASDTSRAMGWSPKVIGDVPAGAFPAIVSVTTASWRVPAEKVCPVDMASAIPSRPLAACSVLTLIEAPEAPEPGATDGLLNIAGLKFKLNPNAFSFPCATNSTEKLTFCPITPLVLTTRTSRACAGAADPIE